MSVDAEDLDWRGATLTALIAWLWIYPSVLVGLHWHDTSEFIASGRALSLAHPPGHPLTVMGIHISQLFPWSDAAERAHLMSSFWGAFGVALSYLGFQQLLIERSRSRSFWGTRVSCAVGALAMLSLPLVRLQAIRAEVYAPQWALTIGVWVALFFAARTQDLRGLVIAALGLGLLAANHTLLTVALIVALLPRLITWRLSLRVWLISSLSLISGASLYIYVWLRGRHGGVSGWGWIDSFDAWWHHVSAKVWQVQVSQRVQELNWSDNVFGMISFALGQVGMVAGLLCVLVLTLGGVRWIRQSLETWAESRSAQSFAPEYVDHDIRHDQEYEDRVLTRKLTAHWGSPLILGTLCIICTKLTYPFSVQNPDFSGYLAAGAPSLLFLLAWVGQNLGRHGALFVLSAVLLGSMSQHQDQRPPASRGAEAWGRQMTSEVSSGGTLWSSFYSSHFITSALWVTEGWRSDVRFVFRGHRAQEWALRRSKMGSELYPLSDLKSPQALSVHGARLEVERPLDLEPSLWPRLTLPGSTYGILTSEVITSVSSHLSRRELWVSSGELVRQLQRHLELSDARHHATRFLPHDSTPPLSYLSDEDSAYAWALHHEMNMRWLTMRILRSTEVQDQERLTSARDAHQELREWWIRHIALDRWDQLHFSASRP